ncbi:MAG: hypothetical protein K2X87_00395 [Gemmataceae bacterium]|nr:hypothetical protein [Gemmataceae bacterium]
MDEAFDNRLKSDQKRSKTALASDHVRALLEEALNAREGKGTDAQEEDGKLGMGLDTLVGHHF